METGACGQCLEGEARVSCRRQAHLEEGGEAESSGDSQSWDSKGTASAIVVSIAGKSVSDSSCSFHVYKLWIVTASQGSDALMFTSRLETPWIST